jgi:hypothetical protein
LGHHQQVVVLIFHLVQLVQQSALLVLPLRQLVLGLGLGLHLQQLQLPFGPLVVQQLLLVQ